jgi:uncharacterized protein
MKRFLVLLQLLGCSKTPPEPPAATAFGAAPIAVPITSPTPNVFPTPILTPPSSAVPEPSAAPNAKVCPRDPVPEVFKPTTHALAFDKGPSVSIELVTTSDETAHGLMYRPSMPDNAGMLFKMKNEVHTFWMHNTCMSLDMLFLDANGVVLGLLESVPPMNDDMRTINQPSVYVLEMNAGYSRKNQIKKGSVLLLNPAIRAQKVP